MDVAGALLDGAGQDSVDQLDDRRLFDLSLEGGDGHFIFYITFLHDLDIFVIELLQNVLQPVLQDLVMLLHRLTQRVLAGDHGLDVIARGEPELVDGIQVGGVRHRHGQRPAHAAQRQHQVPRRDLRLHHLDDAAVDMVDPRQIYGLYPVLAGKHARQIRLGNHTHRHQRVAETMAVSALLVQRRLQLLLRDQTFPDEEVAD